MPDSDEVLLTPEAEVFYFGTKGEVLVCRHETLHMRVAPGLNAAGTEDDHTGLMAWPGLRAACRCLASPRVMKALQGARVIELGAGPGAASAVAARTAEAVLCTDCAEEALVLARATLAANATSTISNGSTTVDTVETTKAKTACARFTWGSDDPNVLLDALNALCAEDFSSSVGSTTEGEVRASSERRGADFVVGSEVVYPSTSTVCLASLFEASRTLLAPNGVRRIFPQDGDASSLPLPCLLLSYVPRNTSTTVNMCAAAWAAGFQWRLWSENSSNNEEAGKATAAASESVLAEAGAVLLVFTLAPSPPQPLVDAPETNSSASTRSSRSAAADGLPCDDATLTSSAFPQTPVEVAQRTTSQQEAFVSGLGPSFEAAVTATFPDVFDSIARAKELAAEWKAEDAGMSWAPGMGSSDEEEDRL